jgi:hypothetical protein
VGGFVCYLAAGNALAFHYYHASSVLASFNVTAYVGKPLLVTCWYSAADNKAHLAINGQEVADSGSTTGVYLAGNSPMRIGTRADNAGYVLNTFTISVVGVAAGNVLPTPAQIDDCWNRVVGAGRIQALSDSDAVYDFLDLPNVPSVVEDSNGTSAGLAKVGDGPNTIQVGTGLYWSRFWMVITGHSWSASDPIGSGGTIGDGSTIGSDATPDEVRATRNIVRLFKAAHEVCPAICVVLDEPTWASEQPDGRWGNPLNRSDSAIYWSV